MFHHQTLVHVLSVYCCYGSICMSWPFVLIENGRQIADVLLYNGIYN